jgi:hypothetical protein
MDLPIPDDFLCTDDESHENCDNNRHKKVSREVLVFTKNILVAGRILCKIGQDEGQQRGFNKVQQDILPVGKFGNQVAQEKYPELYIDIRYPEGGGR